MLLGITLRAVALPLPGTIDVDYFKGWGLAAVDLGVTRVYADTDDGPILKDLCRAWHWCPGASELEPLRSSLERAEPPYYLYVTYPPLTSYLLASVTWLYRSVPVEIRPDWLHNVLVKLPVVLAEAVATLAAYSYIQRQWNSASARIVSAAYWLNPAIITSGASMGYVDAIYIALSSLAFVWTVEARAIPAAGAYTLAVMHKQLAVLYLPVLAVIEFMTVDRRKFLNGVLAGLGTALLLLLPFVLDVRLVGMLRQVAGTSRHPVLSATATNLWWLVTFGMEVQERVGAGMPLLQAFTQETLLLNRRVEFWHLVGLGLYTAFTIWNVFLLVKRRTASAALLAAAMQVYAYSMLMTGVHENHLLGALIFFAMLIPIDRQLRLLYALVSLIVLLNIAVFYGVGLGPRIPRLATGIDVSVLAAGLNTIIFVWACHLVRRGPEPHSPTLETSIPLKDSPATFSD